MQAGLIAALVSLVLIPSPGALAGHECRLHYPAGTRCAESDVTIRHAPERSLFAGRVDSHMRWCERNRVVVLRKVAEGPDPVIGRTKTDSEGRWRIEAAPRSGRFYAMARSKDRYYGIDGHDICYRARSRALEVAP